MLLPRFAHLRIDGFFALIGLLGLEVVFSRNRESGVFHVCRDQRVNLTKPLKHALSYHGCGEARANLCEQGRVAHSPSLQTTSNGVKTYLLGPDASAQMTSRSAFVLATFSSGDQRCWEYS